MAFDFPASPTVGMKFGNYVWDGQKWLRAVATGAVYVGDDPPATPLDNTLWWDATNGLLYIRYNDGNSSQWVLSAPLAVTPPTIVDSGFVRKTGDTMTGDLILDKATPQIVLNKQLATESAVIWGTKGGLSRWAVNLANGVPEAFTSAGSDFNINRYDNTGAFIDNPLVIERATGKVLLTGDPVVPLGAATKNYVDAVSGSGAAFASDSNLAINAGMEISQERGTSSLSLVSGNVRKYVIDGWTAAFSHPTAAMIASQAGVGAAELGTESAISLYANTPLTAVNPADYTLLSHHVEGYRMRKLGWGYAQAKPITISFWVVPPTNGTFGLSVHNHDNTLSYVTEVTTSGPMPQYKSVTIPGSLTHNWNPVDGIGMTIHFSFAAGTNWQTPANTWFAGNKYTTPACTNYFGNSGNYVLITGLVVVPGVVAPTAAQSPLLVRPYGDELVICQRYYETGHGAWSAGVYCNFGFATKRGVPQLALDTIPATAGPFTFADMFYGKHSADAGFIWKADARL